jgi:hypothetical protein
MIRVFASFLLLLGGCAAPLSQVPPAGAPATVSAPTIAVGDTWTYRVHDGYTRLPRPDENLQVKAVSGERIEVVGDVPRSAGSLIFDREWNWLRRPATNMQNFEYKPAYPAFAFPLATGKRWQERVTARDPVDGRTFPVTIQGAVLGWERVKVPAGEFDALKVERVVFFEYWELTVRGRSIIRESDWYAPAVKQSVKREARSEYYSFLAGDPTESGFLRVRGGGGGRDSGGGPRYVLDDWLIYELVSLSIR